MSQAFSQSSRKRVSLRVSKFPQIIFLSFLFTDCLACCSEGARHYCAVCHIFVDQSITHIGSRLQFDAVSDRRLRWSAPLVAQRGLRLILYAGQRARADWKANMKQNVLPFGNAQANQVRNLVLNAQETKTSFAKRLPRNDDPKIDFAKRLYFYQKRLFFYHRRHVRPAKTKIGFGMRAPVNKFLQNHFSKRVVASTLAQCVRAWLCLRV